MLTLEDEINSIVREVLATNYQCSAELDKLVDDAGLTLSTPSRERFIAACKTMQQQRIKVIRLTERVNTKYRYYQSYEVANIVSLKMTRILCEQRSTLDACMGVLEQMQTIVEAVVTALMQ